MEYFRARADCVEAILTEMMQYDFLDKFLTLLRRILHFVFFPISDQYDGSFQSFIRCIIYAITHLNGETEIVTYNYMNLPSMP